jgi:ferric-dicitrate binding protein FerR (iron transport regulator)
MSARRERAVFVAAALALAGSAALAYWLLLARGPAGVASAPAPASSSAPPPTRLSVNRAEGGATLLRAGAGREPLRAGVDLRPEDVLETAEGASVELVAGGSYTVILEGASRFAVKEIATEVSRFRIEDGLVTARVREDPSRAVVVEASGAVARTRGGELAMSSVAGAVSVGVTGGSAEFEAAGQIVTLRPGQGSVAAAGRPPTPPAPLPRSLLLKVDWPRGRKTNVRKLLVRGQATPGAVLTVGGQRVTVGPDGRFTQAVWLREGAQEIDAVARDVAGRHERSRSPVVILDTRAPEAEFDTRSIWKGSPGTDKPQ